MVLERTFLEAIEKRFGKKIDRAMLFDALVEHIFEVTGERLGVNTLKRLFGWIEGGEPQKATLEIIAHYLGYSDWDMVVFVLENSNSAFNPNEECLSVKDLKPGQRLIVRYVPQRELELVVNEQRWCEVVSVSGGKLMVGDLLNIVAIVHRFPFTVNEVIRNGVSLGAYTGGIQGGVTSFNVE